VYKTSKILPFFHFSTQEEKRHKEGRYLEIQKCSLQQNAWCFVGMGVLFFKMASVLLEQVIHFLKCPTTV
jgi:hypothetical protein